MEELKTKLFKQAVFRIEMRKLVAVVQFLHYQDSNGSNQSDFFWVVFSRQKPVIDAFTQKLSW